MFSANNLSKWFMPILIVFSICYSNYRGFDNLNEFFWILNSWAALLVWWRMIFYLQSNSRMSFIISMVLISFVKMIEFIILLTIGVFMFADAIKSLRYILYDEKKMELAVTKVDDPDGFYETFNVWFGEWWSAI